MTILRSLHWTRRHARGYRAARRCVMLDNSVLAGEVLRHGAYVCLRLADGDAVVHVAAPTTSPVSDFCAEATRLLGALARLRVIGGVVRPRTYTGAAMNNFAYAHQVVQQPGRVMPNAFLVPMNKIAAWWAKDWMKREGHALASAAGIPYLLRRTTRARRSRRRRARTTSSPTSSAPTPTCPP